MVDAQKKESVAGPRGQNDFDFSEFTRIRVGKF